MPEALFPLSCFRKLTDALGEQDGKGGVGTAP